MTQKLTWLIAHHPAHLFIRTAEAFNAELNKRIPGQFEIEILSFKEYLEQRGDIPKLAIRPAAVKGLEEGEATSTEDGAFVASDWKDVQTKWKAFFNGIRDKKIHLSQTQVTVIGSHLFQKFKTLDLPFLFRDHDHVSDTLDGPIGDRLLNEMGDATGVRGLGYTYSGGYRIIGSNEEINSLSDLADLEMVTTPNTQMTFRNIAKDAKGRVFKSIETNGDDAVTGAVETTYLRFTGKNILKTEHSMFMTSILVGDEFFNELNEEQQNAFRESAKVVAKLERKWSLEDAEKYEVEAESKGIKITQISQEETAQLQEAAPSDYEFLYSKEPAAQDLVNEIKNH